MTHRADVTRGRDIVARWCKLAEQRLEHLTELFETGRWRRYHSEHAFLENIKEAKTAVETWRDLLTRETSRENVEFDISWLGRARATLPRDVPRRIRPLSPQSAASVPGEPPRAAVATDPEAMQVSLRASLRVARISPSVPTIDAPAVEPELSPAFESVLAPALNAPDLMPNLSVMQQRYPSLRNAL